MSDHLNKFNWSKLTLIDFGKSCSNKLEIKKNIKIKDDKEKQQKDENLNYEKIGFESGYKEGKEIGYKKGFEKGLIEIKNEKKKKILQIEKFLVELKSSLIGLDSVIPSKIMQIAIKISEKIIKQSPLCNTKVILKETQKLLHNKNFLGNNLSIYVHPDDINVLKNNLGDTLKDQGWRILGDSQLLRGGLRIMSENGEIDATLESRWKKICQILKEDNTT